jgi:hypothetical protein
MQRLDDFDKSQEDASTASAAWIIARMFPPLQISFKCYARSTVAINALAAFAMHGSARHG